MESVFDFWRDFCQSERDKALKIGTVPPKSGRMVSLGIRHGVLKIDMQKISFILATRQSKQSGLCYLKNSALQELVLLALFVASMRMICFHNHHKVFLCQ